jgi:hypothetical protein
VLYQKYNKQDIKDEFNYSEFNMLLETIQAEKGIITRDYFIKFYYISKAYYPNFEELIIKVGKVLRY